MEAISRDLLQLHGRVKWLGKGRDRAGGGRRLRSGSRKGRGGATGSICRPCHWSGNSWGRIAPSFFPPLGLRKEKPRCVASLRFVPRHSALKSPAKFPGGRNGHEAQQPLTVPQFHTPPSLQAGVCQGSGRAPRHLRLPIPHSCGLVHGWPRPLGRGRPPAT